MGVYDGPMTIRSAPDAAEIERCRTNLKLERDAVQLYEGLAEIEQDPVRKDAFAAIASGERRHAFVWATRLEACDQEVPDKEPPRWRVRAVQGYCKGGQVQNTIKRNSVGKRNSGRPCSRLPYLS